MKVDYVTLALIFGLSSLISSAVFFALSRVGPQVSGLRYWAFGNLGAVVAIAVNISGVFGDWHVASVVANVAMIVGHGCMLAGVAQFCGRPYARRALTAVVLAGAALTLVFTFIVPVARLRIPSLTLLLGIVEWSSAMLLWRYADPQARVAYRVAGIVSAIAGTSAMTQAILVFTSSGPVSYASPELPAVNAIMFTGRLLNSFVGNWMLFLLVGVRLMGDLRAAAERDALTGLLNRRGMRLVLETHLRRRQRAVDKMAILLLDLDHFKAINDRFGHDVGDRVLTMMGSILRELESPTRYVARWGGEEFCILLIDSGADDAATLAEQLRSRFAETSSSIAGLSGEATTSVGVAVSAWRSDYSIAEVVGAADAALYEAKDAGRNRVITRVISAKRERGSA